MVFINAKVMDPTHLELDAPISAARGRNVLIAVAEKGGSEPERESWYAGASETLRSAYGEDEPEYTVEMVRESNPGYGV